MKLRFVLICIFLMSAMLVGQTFRGTILGTVTDPSGLLVAGATVKVRNVATGLERTTTTTGDGSYAIPELPIGTYTVTISQPGFQTSITTERRSKRGHRAARGRAVEDRSGHADGRGLRRRPSPDRNHVQ